MLISVPDFKVYSIRLPRELKERIEPADEKAERRAEKGEKKPVGFSGGRQGGFSLLVRQLCHLYLGEQMAAGQWRLDIDDNSPLRRAEARVYELEAATYDEGRELTAEELAELAAIEARMLDLAHELVAGREPSFDQTLALVLYARCQILAEHLDRGRRK